MTEVTHAKMAGRFQTFEELENLLKDLNNINLNNIDKVIEMLKIEIEEAGFQSLYMFMNIKDTSLLPCENIGNGAKYFLAMCYMMKGDYKKAEEILENIVFVAQNLMPQAFTTVLLKAVYYYTSAMNKLHNHEDSMYYIHLLFDEEIADAIDENFRDRKTILIKHYGIKPEDYVNNDDDYYLPFMKTLKKAQKENVIDQMELGKIFDLKKSLK